MSDKKYYKFTERNDWEGESWNFYLPLNDKQHEKLSNLILGMEETYKLSKAPLDEKFVDSINRTGSTTYMHKHNKCAPIKELPNVIDFDKEDPFYKGGHWERIR